MTYIRMSEYDIAFEWWCTTISVTANFSCGQNRLIVKLLAYDVIMSYPLAWSIVNNFMYGLFLQITFYGWLNKTLYLSYTL